MSKSTNEMTDRELLELAAKAAGIGVEWREVIRSRIAEFQTIKHSTQVGFWLNGKQWNPLTDDGDALRLAVKLNMSVDCNNWCAKSTQQETYEWVDGGCDDPFTATRRAIVRTAAQLARAS